VYFPKVDGPDSLCLLCGGGLLRKANFNIGDVCRLAELVERYCLAELTVEEDGLCITIKGRPAAGGSGEVVVQEVVQHAATVQPQATKSPAAPKPRESPAVSQDANLRRIVAPMVGVFYRSPSPDQPPYVEVGNTIEEGQIIGLIEAMKVFSEIPSEISGEVVEIPAQNAKLVQQGAPLIVVRV
jgi:acetyl-CoA carboxylase biotin carboxyl carrier protein